MRIVHTVLNYFNLKELCNIDGDSHQKGGNDVHDHPVAPALDLPEVVRSTDSQVSLHSHGYDQADAKAHHHSENISKYKSFKIIISLGTCTLGSGREETGLDEEGFYHTHQESHS